MRRILYRFLSLLIVISVFSSICLDACAYDEEYKTFLQGDSRWGSYVYGGGATIGYSGCMITGLAILAAYADPELRDVEKFNPEICARDYCSFAGDCIYWDMRQGPLTRVDGQVDVSSKESIKKALDEGYYILAWGPVYSGTHYSPIVGWDDEKSQPIIYDVARGWSGPGWDEFTQGGIGASNFHVYSAENPSYEAFGGSSDIKSDSDSKAKEEEAYSYVLSEWELYGMPTRFAIDEELVAPSFGGRGNLLLNELQSLQTIQDDLSESGMSAYRILRVIVSLLGIILIIYAILLWLGSIFDRTNNFVDVSLVSIFTLGSVQLLYYGEEVTNELKKNGYIPYKTLCLRCVIIFIVGALMLSGVVLRLLSMFVFAVYSLF